MYSCSSGVQDQETEKSVIMYNKYGVEDDAWPP